MRGQGGAVGGAAFCFPKIVRVELYAQAARLCAPNCTLGLPRMCIRMAGRVSMHAAASVHGAHAHMLPLVCAAAAAHVGRARTRGKLIEVKNLRFCPAQAHDLHPRWDRPVNREKPGFSAFL